VFRTRNSAALSAACLCAAQLLTVPLSQAQTSPNWAGNNIGAVGAAGSYAVSNNSFTVLGSGADIWNTNDEFYFVYRTLTGDGEITAQVASVTNTNEWTKAGVMLRESLAANSRFALMCVTPGKGAAFNYRSSTGGSAGPSNSGDLTTKAPYWVRVTRQGTSVSGYLSPDGVNWTLRRSVTLSNLSSTLYVGLALTSHLDGTLATAVFNNPAIVTPGGGGTADTTAPSVPQNVRATASSPTSVALTWSASTDTGGSGLAGYRIFRNGSSTPLATVSTTSYNDTTVAANTSYTYTVAARDNAGNQSLLSAAASVTTPASVNWTAQDIGAVGAAGSHSISGNTFTVRASGADIWNTADEFYYVYRTLTGDGEMTARVSSITNTNEWTKAGVMMRESLAANSRFALMCVTPGKGATFHYRTATGGSAAPKDTSNFSIKAPYWVRVKREGVIVRGYYSPDGTNWTLHQSVTLSSLASTIYVGLALTSHLDGTLATAVFDNPAVIGPGTTPDTTVPSVPQNVRATAASSTSITVSWDASTDTGGSGLAGYRIFRNGSTTALATVTGTSYTDTNLSPSTSYSYRVRAFDGANNQSALSSAASVTTPATPPPPVSGLDTRPVNNTCLAWDRPTAGSISLSRYTNLSFNSSVLMLQPPNASTHWYVVEQGGIVKRFAVASPTTTTQFINLTSRITSGGEMGLLGMAFHPSFPTDKRVFLSYTVRVGTQLVSRVSSFVSNDGGVTLAPSSESILLTLNQPEDNHNGGNIAFGPDGYLYIGFGDGGGSGDAHGTNGNGQRLTTMLGKMLRIDVNGAAPYSVPSSNPFFNSANPGDRCPAGGRSSGNCPEIYAYGFRNPWRWSFDRGSSDLWVADVGQNNWEEVDRVQRGGNYGWRCREGAHDYKSSSTPACAGATLIDPVAEYSHSLGASITGGYVYRGTQNTTLKGRYIFGDFVSGRIFAWIAESATQPRQPTQLLDSSLSIASFAQGNDGELYVVDYGSLHRIVFAAGSGGGTTPTTLSATGCANPADAKQPSSGLIPYGVNAQFWSDGAAKHRWIGLPNGTSIVVQSNGDWDFPAGTVLRKDFRLGTQLVETRLLLRHPDGNWGGFTYEWNTAQTDATLLRGGAVRTINSQQWIFPSEGQCLECHTAAAGRTLGPQTAQLNGTFTYPQTGRTANQLYTLNHIGVLSPPITDPAAQPKMPDPADTSAPLANRARAWLDTNCSQCHRPNGPTPSTMDLRYTTPLSSTNTCNALPQSGDLGLGVDARLIAPGSATNSIVVNRANRRDANAMPPLGSARVDTAGVTLLTSWINSLSGC
jgi:uncharacterized repeat protein (TIGR03806 family)